MPRDKSDAAYPVFEGAFVGTRIYVGNLPYNTDDAQLHQLCKNFPEVVFEGKYEAPAGFGIGAC